MCSLFMHKCHNDAKDQETRQVYICSEIVPATDIENHATGIGSSEWSPTE